MRDIIVENGEAENHEDSKRIGSAIRRAFELKYDDDVRCLEKETQMSFIEALGYKVFTTKELNDCWAKYIIDAWKSSGCEDKEFAEKFMAKNGIFNNYLDEVNKVISKKAIDKEAVYVSFAYFLGKAEQYRDKYDFKLTEEVCNKAKKLKEIIPEEGNSELLKRIKETLKGLCE
jgi:hypothetical protein